ncbi:uncharacterized protein LOC127866820 isoform X2 [Dreissena polymorpha]|nr:uncharacterized protein LOC127866820 isoform X2 [Dreissena polymorpha]XP_052263605.1 uncharacterized protein LOC127866820 isoform X2 [Dreissena polymorpha]
MAFFDHLKQLRSPKERLRDSVTKNDVQELLTLLAEGIDPNMPLNKYGDNTAIHLAAVLGHFLCIKELINAGVDCDLPNGNDITPLFNAARREHVLAMKMLLRHSHSCHGLSTLWYDGRWTEFLHSSASDSVLTALLISSPDINRMRKNLTSNILASSFHRKFYQSVYAFFLTGYHCDDTSNFIDKVKKAINDQSNSEDASNGDTPADKFLLQTDSLLNMKCTHRLQHLCRLKVRNSFHNCNVFYGSEQLHLPTSLKKYLLYEGEL